MKMTYDKVALAWLLGAPSKHRNLYTEDNDLYSYSTLIGRWFWFHDRRVVLLIDHSISHTTGRHLAAANRQLLQLGESFSLQKVDDVTHGHDAWIRNMFGQVDDLLQNHTQFIAIGQ